LFIHLNKEIEKSFCKDFRDCQVYFPCSYFITGYGDSPLIQKCQTDFVFDEDKQECVQPTKREDFECLLGSKFPSAYVEEDDDDDNESEEDINQSKDNGIITKPLSKIFITPLLKKITQTTLPPVSNLTKNNQFNSTTSVKTTSTESSTTISSSTVKQTNKKRYSSLRAKDKQRTTNKKKSDENSETNEEETENYEEQIEAESSIKKKSKEQDVDYNDDSDNVKKSNSEDTEYEDVPSNNDDNSNQPDYRRMCVVTNW
jgi:hypothetical protein